MPFPWIVGALVVGGVLYLFSDEDEGEEYDEDERNLKIKELRRQLQKEQRRKKAFHKKKAAMFPEE